MKFSSVGIVICLFIIKGLVIRGGVHQSPHSLEAPVGANVKLNCHFDEPASELRVVAFRWDLPNGRVYSVAPTGRTGGKTSQRLTLRTDLRARSSELRISRVSPQDGGRYVCVIQLLEPLPVIQMKGGGTQLHIVQGNTNCRRTNETTVVTALPKPTVVSGNVTQSPALLSVATGEPVNLTCTLRTTATDVAGMKFVWKWKKSLTTCLAAANSSKWWQCNPVPDPRILVTADLQTKSSDFTITQAFLNDSGSYKCEVVITGPLPIVKFAGSGSVVLVEGDVQSTGTNESVLLLPASTDREAGRRRMEPWLFISLLCVIGVSLVGGLGSSCWTTRQFHMEGPHAHDDRERRGHTVRGSKDVLAPVTHGCQAAL